jgi:hypothetical protein
MVDSRRRRDKSSPELSPPVATVSESSSRLEKLGEGNDVKLTRGFSERCGIRGRLAAKKQIGDDFFSWSGGEVRGRGGRATAVGECGFNGFCYEVEKEGGKGSRSGAA